jgi:hypothetical protein
MLIDELGLEVFGLLVDVIGVIVIDELLVFGVLFIFCFRGLPLFFGEVLFVFKLELIN